MLKIISIFVRYLQKAREPFDWGQTGMIKNFYSSLLCGYIQRRFTAPCSSRLEQEIIWLQKRPKSHSVGDRITWHRIFTSVNFVKIF